MESNNVKKIVAYRLTSKGSELALDLSGNMEHPWEHRAGTVDDEILSCIDAALDSFGPKFKSTVYTRFEIMYNHGRKEIPERAKEFVSMLKLFQVSLFCRDCT